MTHATIEIDGIEYSATVSDERVTLYREGSWLGKGYWREGMIEGCSVAMPEDIYVALDRAIAATMAKVA